MDKSLKVGRGLDLSIKGGAEWSTPQEIPAATVALIPDDFPGFLPKLEVKEGDKVIAGSPLMYDKNHEEIKLTSPVAGTVSSVIRGERRKIERVIITAEGNESKTFTVDSTAASIAQALKESGLWAEMRQRPYDIVPLPDREPRDIFVTAFDSSPLAPDFNEELRGKQKEITAGIKALASLTKGKVYVSTRPEDSFEIPAEAVHCIVEGPHPSGNAGVQASLIAPINKGETVWTLSIATVARIGALCLTGKRDYSTVVAVTGPEIVNPYYAETVQGAAVKTLLGGHLPSDGKHLRIISGNILTGTKINEDGYLRFPYTQVTVMAEGDDVDEFMGWASLSPSKMSVSRSFPFSFFKKRFSPDARILGGRRAMIMSGEYDKVMPMDIMPEYLLKAIGAHDIDMMEKLGIYEVAPEDFALCEYVDPSKTEIQKAVREGLDWLRKEIE
ncbi:MAG: Na(+)-translocating NADH-quinone reductase subunit A [Paramuribaculum sp.]|nr:Na(+)-translocating NADH-quinone reductase subunit A [Paramuribaculum sp.]